MDLSKLEKKTVRIVKQAARIWNRGTGTITEKNGAANIVTEADLAVQRFLQSKLSQILPGAGFFCEEGDVADLQKEYRWVIDPIDGTTNFARGLPECVISVALVHNDEPVLGVVFAPRLKLLFSAVKGKGAFCCGKRIHVSQKTFAESLFCTALCLYQKELAGLCSQVISQVHPQCSDIRRFGSCALELCYLALGRCDIYFEIRTYPWDYAAGLLMVEEAGGILRGYRGEKLNLREMTMLVGANNPENYHKLEGIVSEIITERPCLKE